VTDDIDRMLEQSLSADFDGMRSATPVPAPRYAPVAARRGSFRRRLRFGVPLVLGTNMLIGASVVTIAAASVGAKTVVTGSPDPLVWNRQTAQVSPSPEQLGRDGRSPDSEPTDTSRGGESPGSEGGDGSNSDHKSPQPSSDSGKNGGPGSKGGGDTSAAPSPGDGGGHDDSSPSTPSDGSHH
jgi:hypothetical protein